MSGVAAAPLALVLVILATVTQLVDVIWPPEPPIIKNVRLYFPEKDV